MRKGHPAGFKAKPQNRLRALGYSGTTKCFSQGLAAGGSVTCTLGHMLGHMLMMG